MQTGACCPVSVVSPEASASPCADESYVVSTPAWQAPHVALTFMRWSVDSVESFGSTRCASWQSLQVADTVSPDCVSASPCAERRKSFTAERATVSPGASK
jgi:hypothetical protein